MRFPASPALLPSLLALAALAAPAPAADIDVDIQGFGFHGQHITIHLGDTVHWRNLDSVTHTVTEGTDLVLNGNEAFHQSFPGLSPIVLSVTFDAAFLAANPRPNNRYDYFCVPHAGAMRGSVTVDTGPGELFCFCWPARPCPASNRDAGAGCFNSSAVRGGRMMGEGSASVAADDLVLRVELLPANRPAIVLRSANPSGLTPFADGFLCLGAPLLRLKQRVSGATGAVLVGPGLVAGQSPTSSPIQPGQTWRFQCWYRDPTGPCASGANVTNGYAVTFTP